jgi:hypothetical protein
LNLDDIPGIQIRQGVELGFAADSISNRQHAIHRKQNNENNYNETEEMEHRECCLLLNVEDLIVWKVELLCYALGFTHFTEYKQPPV